MCKLIRILLCSAFLFMIGTSLAQNSPALPQPMHSDAKPTPVLHFATHSGYAPFEYIDSSSGGLKGFDIDIANALCAQMQVKCTFSDEPNPSLIAQLEQGKYDAIIRAISITDARKRRIDFTNPYFKTTGSIVASIDSGLKMEPDKLKNKVFGVQPNTTFDIYLNAKYSNLITVKPYDDIQEALQDLSNRNIDAVMGDTPVIKLWMDNQPPAKFEIIADLDDPVFFGPGFGIGVRKGNTQLLNALNNALATIKANGTYDAIVNKYFGQ